MGGENEAHFSERPVEEAGTELLSPDPIIQVSILCCQDTLHSTHSDQVFMSLAQQSLSTPAICQAYNRFAFFPLYPLYM